VVRRCERPEQNYIKVNCDAAYDPQSGNGGWGCVLRDADGDVVSAQHGRVEALMSALHGELIAIIHGTQAATDAGVGHVIIETDAVEVVQAVYPDAFELSAVTNLVAELRSLLDFNFISWHVQHCPHSCNKVAHELAALGNV
jgi:ribonuclease HI